MFNGWGGERQQCLAGATFWKYIIILSLNKNSQSSWHHRINPLMAPWPQKTHSLKSLLSMLAEAAVASKDVVKGCFFLKLSHRYLPRHKFQLTRGNEVTAIRQDLWFSIKLLIAVGKDGKRQIKLLFSNQKICFCSCLQLCNKSRFLLLLQLALSMKVVKPALLWD